MTEHERRRSFGKGVWANTPTTSATDYDAVVKRVEELEAQLKVKQALLEVSNEMVSLNIKISRRHRDRAERAEAENKRLRAALETIALYEDYEDMELSAADMGLSYVEYLEMTYDNIRGEALNEIASEERP